MTSSNTSLLQFLIGTRLVKRSEAEVLWQEAAMDEKVFLEKLLTSGLLT